MDAEQLRQAIRDGFARIDAGKVPLVKNLGLEVHEGNVMVHVHLPEHPVLGGRWSHYIGVVQADPESPRASVHRAITAAFQKIGSDVANAAVAQMGASSSMSCTTAEVE